MVLMHPKLDYPITKLLGTEFIISHAFQRERYFSFACPGSIIWVILLDTVPYIYIYILVPICVIVHNTYLQHTF